MSGGSGRGRWIAAATGALLAVAAAGLGLALRERSALPAPRSPAERPELLVLTSLPIVFPEDFSLDAPGSPALEALQSRYRVRPISLADKASLGGSRLLLMAQPRAQPAQVLVELDQWVRGGGHVLLLADPALEWPSERPLGDLLRPPATFADTGLLGHWGLRLDAPDEPGPRAVRVNGREARADSPGRLVAIGPGCALGPQGFVARCRIGQGEATVIADADFIDIERVEGASGAANIELLLSELEQLGR